MFHADAMLVTNFWPLTVRRLKCRKSTFFRIPIIFQLKFGGVPFGVDPSCWGVRERKGYAYQP